MPTQFVDSGIARSPVSTIVQIRLNQAAYLYVVNVRGSTFLLTFGAGALDADVRHALVHTCGADVDAVPLWRRPEWS